MFLCFFMVIVMHCVYAVTDANLVLLADNVFSICNIFLYVCFIFCHFGLIYNEKGCVTALIGYTTLSRFFFSILSLLVYFFGKELSCV